MRFARREVIFFLLLNVLHIQCRTVLMPKNGNNTVTISIKKIEDYECNCPHTFECFINDKGLADCRCPENHKEIKRYKGKICLKKCSRDDDCSAHQKCHYLNDGEERVCENCNCQETFECFINDEGLSECRCPANHIESHRNNDKTCLKCNCLDTFECFVNDEGFPDCKCPVNHKEIKKGNGRTCLKKCSTDDDCIADQKCHKSIDGAERVCEKCNCHDAFECFINNEGLSDCWCPENHKEIKRNNAKRCLKTCWGDDGCSADEKCFDIKDGGLLVCEKCNCPNTFECYINDKGFSDCKCPAYGKEIQRDSGRICLNKCYDDYHCSPDQKCIDLKNRGERVCEKCSCQEPFVCFLNAKGLSDCRCPADHSETERDNIRTCLKKCDGDDKCLVNEKCHELPNGEERVCEECTCDGDYEICSFQNGNKYCDCEIGFPRKNGVCTGKDPCAYNPCHNGGKCIANGLTLRCECDPPYSGNMCETGPCSSNPCQNGGRCRVKGLTFNCDCNPPYYGNTCEIVTDPCSSNPCQNGGKCKVNGLTFKCDCNPPYYGYTCEKDPCSSNPCQNGGSCNVNGLTFNCDCNPPYYGKSCEKVTDPCSSNPCQNGGKCSVNGLTFNCDCNPPYYGSTCERVTDPCSSNPCQNGGSCNVNGLTFNCVCNPPYYGNTCEKVTDPCSSNPCQNGGRCNVNGLTFKCDCIPPYLGYVCEKECNCGVNAQSCFFSRNGSKVCNCDFGYKQMNGECSAICNGDKCLNGRCEVIGNDFKCRCNEGFTGSRCEDKAQVISNEQDLKLILLLSITFATFMLLFGMFCFLFGALNKEYKK